jgi:hypothetical protein
MANTANHTNESRSRLDGRERRGGRWLPPFRRTAAVATALLGFAILAAACSSGGKGPHVAGGGPGASDHASASALALAFAKCMRAHGLSDFPDPVAEPGGGFGFTLNRGPGSDLNPDNPTFKAAQQACQSLRLAGPPASPAQAVAQGVNLARCLRSHGFPSFPDPNSQGAFDLNGIDMNSSQFQSAMQTCQSLTKFQGPMRVDGGT